MLAIRMQRTGRHGHAQFRVVVQDSRFSPKSGRVVAYLGNYNPHTKTASLDGEKSSLYLEQGAQPSDRVARLFKSEGIKLPTWVKLSSEKKRPIKNSEKLRRNQPAEAKAPAEEAPETSKEQAETAASEETQEVSADQAEAPQTETSEKENKETPAKA